MTKYIVHALDAHGRYFCEVLWSTTQARAKALARRVFTDSTIIHVEVA